MLALFLFFFYVSSSTVYNFLSEGGIPFDSSITTCNLNTKLFNDTLLKLNSGDTFLIPLNYSFWFIGGISGSNLTNITFSFDGSIHYTNNRSAWPTQSNGHVKECMYFSELDTVTFTSINPNKGLIDGNGKKWWGAIKYLIHDENRPRLLHVDNSKNIVIYNLYFKNSPYWNVLLSDVRNVEISFTNVSARREEKLDYHDIYDLTAFNTDGFDVSGSNIYIHDCEIWNDDDCIAVKQQDGNSKQSSCSENMLFERINASGVGLTIGSIGPSSSHSCVRNITFRNCYMKNTFKGIYMKSRPGNENDTGEITDVLYENITMDHPTQVSIWIGPQQAGYSGACKILWPEIPFLKCPVPNEITWNNITLRNIVINNPRQSPGVVLGNETNPMKNIIFDNVVINNPGMRPWGTDYYYCYNCNNCIANGITNPVPPCFINDTSVN